MKCRACPNEATGLDWKRRPWCRTCWEREVAASTMLAERLLARQQPETDAALPVVDKHTPIVRDERVVYGAAPMPISRKVASIMLAQQRRRARAAG